MILYQTIVQLPACTGGDDLSKRKQAQAAAAPAAAAAEAGSAATQRMRCKRTGEALAEQQVPARGYKYYLL